MSFKVVRHHGQRPARRISAAHSQVELQVLRDKCEEQADDVRAVAVLVHALRTAPVRAGIVKGEA